jgi:hypothetical protein
VSRTWFELRLGLARQPQIQVAQQEERADRLLESFGVNAAQRSLDTKEHIRGFYKNNQTKIISHTLVGGSRMDQSRGRFSIWAAEGWPPRFMHWYSCSNMSRNISSFLKCRRSTNADCSRAWSMQASWKSVTSERTADAAGPWAPGPTTSDTRLMRCTASSRVTVVNFQIIC